MLLDALFVATCFEKSQVLWALFRITLHNGEHLLWLKLIQSVQTTINPILLLQFVLEAFIRKWKVVNLLKLAFSHDILLGFFYCSEKLGLLSSLATQGHKITNILSLKPVQRLCTKFCVQSRLRNCLMLKLDTPSLKKQIIFSFIKLQCFWRLLRLFTFETPW